MTTLHSGEDRENSILLGTDGVFSFDAHSINPEYKPYTNPYYSIDSFGGSAISDNKNFIIQSASKYGVDPDLYEAIIYLENSHGWYDYFDPSPNSIRPANINVDKWHELLPEYTIDEIKNSPELNIELGAKLLSEIQKRVPAEDVEGIATLYNNLRADNITEYGLTVKEYYDTRPWSEDADDISYRAQSFRDAISNDPDLLKDGNFLSNAHRLLPTEEFRSVLDSHPDGHCFLAGTMISMWDGTEKPIEEITPDDWVVSTDKDGSLVPGRVTRTFQNQAKIILDYHGTMVTPGHAYFCTDGKFDGKYVPLIDILRSDGCVQKMDGTKIRAATNVPMGAPLDSFVWAVSGEKRADGGIVVAEKGKLRLGTRFITDDGRDLCVWDLISNMGCLVTPEGLLVRDNRSQDKRPFHWPFGINLPKPEDYVLQRSAVTLDEIYRASEWEQHQPQLPAPNVGEAGPSLTHRPDIMKLAPVQPNIPLSMRDDPNGPGLSRQQRRALEARKRKAEGRKKRKGVVH